MVLGCLKQHLPYLKNSGKSRHAENNIWDNSVSFLFCIHEEEINNKQVTYSAISYISAEISPTVFNEASYQVSLHRIVAISEFHPKQTSTTLIKVNKLRRV